MQGPHLPLPKGNKHFMEALSPDVKLDSKAKENPEMYLSLGLASEPNARHSWQTWARASSSLKVELFSSFT